MAKLLGEELHETPESYWAAAQRCDDVGLHQDACELRAYARIMDRGRRVRSAAILVVLVVWALIVSRHVFEIL